MQSRVSAALVLGVCLGVLGLSLWLGLRIPAVTTPLDRLNVVTTIYPLADFVKHVGGEFVYVSNLIPAGVEPHDYEPTPRQVAQVLEADVLIYLGGGLDDWAGDLVDEAARMGNLSLSIEKHVPLTEHDPHIWLDPIAAEDIVTAIRDTLMAADPLHAEVYLHNAAVYLESLRALDSSFTSTLSHCQLNAIIVSHDAFSYLGRRYNFDIYPISGLSPEAEPSANDLVRLAQTARELGITTIFFETLVSPKLSATLAQEIAASTAVLNPLEGLSQAELQAGDNYLTVMDKNREALGSAMLCQ